ncbi:MAG: nicotinate-nucleotide--dimethylbenzimidazole phosphoribosyltransferase [Syntrophomonadaceae bacterium]|jgi:nicotinate-nucleotide--dimethylbenzimidazole phosphoribosyltransferase|nr:nicotinate-nucleotide--dimethylbenzimidazole phosphoribosyltransferase [Syntrophomonadaceae bacterium]
MELLNKTLASIGDLDVEAANAAQARLDNLTKPQGSLGIMEQIVVRLAAIQGKAIPSLGPKVVMVMAGDHGVVAEGVSAYPQEVTPQMVLNFLNNGAAINVFSNYTGSKVVVTDVGVIGPAIEHPRLNVRKIREGTRNMAREAAMTEAEALAAITVGIEMVQAEIEAGATLIATGEMGIGNTTPSSAILAAFSGVDLDIITGRGTGIDDVVRQRKIAVIKQALEVNQPDPNQPLDVLRKVGGLEIAALTGVILGAAAHRVAVVVDGFISTAAALVAYKMNPDCRKFLFASHLSQEPGHRIMLEYMGLQPILHLDLRLGEGTGAVLTFPIFEAALKAMQEMATFGEAGVSNKE